MLEVPASNKSNLMTRGTACLKHFKEIFIKQRWWDRGCMTLVQLPVGSGIPQQPDTYNSSLHPDSFTDQAEKELTGLKNLPERLELENLL